MIALNHIKSKAVRWVSKAMSKDPSRPVLQNFGVNGVVAAADGFRLHMTPNEVNPDEYPPVPALPEGTYRLDAMPVVKAGEIVGVNKTEDGGPYPDVFVLIPRREPAFTICVNPKYLADALSGMTEMVKLTFFDSTSPVLVQGTIEGKHDELPALAVIMPMHDNGKLWWLPK